MEIKWGKRRVALHSKKDFSGLCGMKTNKLSVYIKRNKVILSGEYIDDSIQQNSEFLVKHSCNKPGNTNTAITPNISPPEIPSPTSPIVKEPSNLGLVQLDEEYKIKLIAKLDVETRIKEIQEQKIKGEVIPYELFQSVFAQFTQTILSEFQDSSENLITEVTHKAKLNINEIAEIPNSLMGQINYTVEKAIKIA